MLPPFRKRGHINRFKFRCQLIRGSKVSSGWDAFNIWEVRRPGPTTPKPISAKARVYGSIAQAMIWTIGTGPIPSRPQLRWYKPDSQPFMVRVLAVRKNHLVDGPNLPAVSQRSAREGQVATNLLPARFLAILNALFPGPARESSRRCG